MISVGRCCISSGRRKHLGRIGRKVRLQGLEEGDLLAGANTVIYLAKIRDGNRMARGLYIAKHRGSACDDSIVPFEITDTGIAVNCANA